MSTLFDSLTFANGLSSVNRFVLAPMTNQQSHDSGRLSDEELNWLTMRAKGGFGMTITCASHVTHEGRGWPGAMGVHDDALTPELRQASEQIKAQGSLPVVQLFHGGIRAPQALSGQQPVAPSAHAETNARALSTDEVKALVQAFVDAAVRCENAGMSGVELHGAHGYLICQFLSEQYNQRTDEYGGSYENRCRFLWQIIDGIRQQCSPDFLLGVRLSLEHHGLALDETLKLAEELMASGKIEFLDVSLWDCFKQPESSEHQQKRLLDWILEVPRAGVALGVAGNLKGAKDVQQMIDAGADFVAIGTSAILHHDFPQQVRENHEFLPRTLPVASDVLLREGVSEKFVKYMRRWDNFVAD